MPEILPRHGRPPKYSLEQRQAIVSKVEDYMNRKKCGVKEACEATKVTYQVYKYQKQAIVNDMVMAKNKGSNGERDRKMAEARERGRQAMIAQGVSLPPKDDTEKLVAVGKQKIEAFAAQVSRGKTAEEILAEKCMPVAVAPAPVPAPVVNDAEMKGKKAFMGKTSSAETAPEVSSVPAVRHQPQPAPVEDEAPAEETMRVFVLEGNVAAVTKALKGVFGYE